MAGIGLRDALRIGRLDAHGQAALLRAGEVSAAELVDAAILRIERLDPAVNAVSHRAFELARSVAARVGRDDPRPLAGVPFLIKDSLAYPGLPSRAASRSRTDAPATEAYPFIRRFDEAGLVPAGKSSMAEFGLLVSNEPLRYGPTNNPWDLARSPGGSSGGAAAAVAAGLVPLAHGSDAAGSIRVPAAACGLVGFKPSRGAHVRARTAHWLDDMLCSDGMLARSVRDAAWAFATSRIEATQPVTAPPERPLRIALVMEGLNGRPPSAEVARAVEAAAELCRSLGHSVEAVARPQPQGEVLYSLMEVLWPFLGLEAVEQCAERPLADRLEPWTVALAEHCAKIAPGELERALGVLTRAPELDGLLYRDHDVVLTATLAEPSLATGALAPDLPFAEILDRFVRFSPYTPLQNMAGSPAISLPLFTSSAGQPAGVMFCGPRGADERLLSLALQLEAAQPWAERWPALYAEAEAAA
jgi:amidase